MEISNLVSSPYEYIFFTKVLPLNSWTIIENNTITHVIYRIISKVVFFDSLIAKATKFPPLNQPEFQMDNDYLLTLWAGFKKMRAWESYIVHILFSGFLNQQYVYRFLEEVNLEYPWVQPMLILDPP